MTRRGWIATLLAAAALAAAALLAWRPRVEAMAASRVATAQAPARLCTTYPVATVRDLKVGTQRLVVVVKSFQPPRSGDSALVAWLAAGGRRVEITRFGIFPLRAFTAQQTQDHQRFSMPLGDAAQQLGENVPVCIEVGFDDAGRGAHGGTAEIDIELATGKP